MKRHLFGTLRAGAAIALIVGCAEDPTGSLRGTVASVELSRSSVELRIGATTAVVAAAVDAQGNALPTAPTVTSNDPAVATVTGEAGSGSPFSQTAFTVTATGNGTTEITASAGSQTGTLTVVAYPAAVSVSGADTVVSGATEAYTAQALSTDGQPVTGPTPVTFTWVADDELVGTVDPSTGGTTNLTGNIEGSTVLTATAGGGASTTKTVQVVAGLPVSAIFCDPTVDCFFASNPPATTFGAVGSAGTARLEVVTFDPAGNTNYRPSDLMSVTASSADPGVATVATSVEERAGFGGRMEEHYFVTATGVGGGSTDISASIETVAGTLVLDAIPVTVLAPAVTAAAPAGLAGATIMIDGNGLAATGFLTQVLVDGSPVGNVISASNSQVTAQMPTLLAGTYDLQVSVGGVESNADSWTQTADFIEAATEPNDDLGQEAPITASFEFSGTNDEATDFDDLFEFTVTEDNLVIALELTWGDGNDLDALIYPKGDADPGTYGADDCGFALASLDEPEVGTCQLGAAGTYVLEIMHYGAGPTTYTIKGIIQ